MGRLASTLGERHLPRLPASPSISRSSSAAQPSASCDPLPPPHLTYAPPRSRAASFPTQHLPHYSDDNDSAPLSPSLSSVPHLSDPAPLDPPSPSLSPSPIPPSTGKWSGRLLRLVSRFPLLVMCVCLIPTVVSILLLLLPSGWQLRIDYTYDQFKIQGDSTTVHDDMNTAARQLSWAYNKPKAQTTQAWGGEAAPVNTSHTFTTSSLVPAVLPPPSALSFHSLQYIHRAYLGETLTVIYVADPKQGVHNLLSSTIIRRIRAIERAITSAPGYDSHCRVYYQGESQGQCILPSSLLNFIYASKASDSTLVFDGRGADLMDPTAVAIGLLMNGRNGFFDRACSMQRVETSTLISQFTFGLPLPGYADISDRLGQQRRQLSAWMVQFDSILGRYDGVGGLRVLREGGDIVQSEIDGLLLRDLWTVLASIGLVFVYMVWHTRSLFLTVSSMLMMAASFPPVTLLYRTCFGTSMSLMNIVAVWLILGIGTDDVFIYVDMWAQYAQRRSATLTAGKTVEADSVTPAPVDLSLAGLSARLAWTHRKAASAMLVTSFTTAAGFFSTSVSLLLPIRQFGFFLGSVVVLNYLLVISFFPAAVIAHAKYRERVNRAICCGRYAVLVRLMGKLFRRGPAKVAAKAGGGARSASPLPLPSHTDLILSEAEWSAECASIVSPPRSPTAVMELLHFGAAAQQAKASHLSDLQQSLLGEEEKEPADAHVQSARRSRASSLLTSVQALIKGKLIDASPPHEPSPPHSHSLRDRFVSGYFSWVYRLRWLILIGFVLFVALLAVRIPSMQTPSELPQILPPSSNVEQLRAMKKLLACDRCVQGGLDVEANNAPATCPISRCSDPAQFAGCDDVDCGQGGICQLGVCLCKEGYFGVRCDGVDVCFGHDCGSHGLCSNTTGRGRCECRDGWTGEGCEVSPICRNVQCGEHGVCDNTGGQCQCLDGFTGAQCQTAPPSIPRNSSTSVLPISADLSIQVYFLFGVASVDMSNADNQNPGEPLFDPAFDPSTSAAQSHLLAFCNALFNNSHARHDLFRCPMLTYSQWMRDAVKHTDWPVTPPSLFTSTFLQFMRSYDSRDLETDVGFELVRGGGGQVEGNGTVDRMRMTFMRASTRTLVDKDLSGLLLQGEYEWWEGWFEGWNERAPVEVKGVQTSSTWPRMKTELAFISGTLMSMLLSIVIVSLSILIFTGNAWLMLFTSLIITCIVLCLLGFFVLWGWPLGALEAISVPLVVGLSVDYCLHLSHAYAAVASEGDDSTHEGKKGTPWERKSRGAQRRAQTRRALLRIGPSITAASLTTIACMSVLLLCRIVVFVEFGLIVAVTLAMGLVFTMTVFLVGLAMAGPLGRDGDVKWAGKRLWRGVRKGWRACRGGMAEVGEDEAEGGEGEVAVDGVDVRRRGQGSVSSASLEQLGLSSGLLDRDA